jgi:hypothetical protein
LNLIQYPTNSAGTVLAVGTSTHYRVTPATAVTLIAMRDSAPPGPDRDALDRVLAPICDHLVSRYSPAEIAAAEATGARPLPSVDAMTTT